MSPREWRHFLRDMLECAQRCLAYTQAMDFDSFQADRKTVDAVIRNLTIIGEAAGRIPPDVMSRHSGIPWSLAKGMRNLVVHQYWSVDLTIVWQTLEQDLPDLAAQLEQALSQPENLV